MEHTLKIYSAYEETIFNETLLFYIGGVSN